MLSVQGIAVPRSKEICSLQAIGRLHAQNHASRVRSMPVEIVAIIFGFVFRSSDDPISQSISLSHVCRRWRQISLSTPRLWTSIPLLLPLSRSRLARMYASLIRSRDQPLDIYMDFRDPSWDWDETTHTFDGAAMDSVMRLLAPHASRWRSVHLLTDTWAPIFTFLSWTTIVPSAPLLETVQLARCNEYLAAPGETFRPAALARPVPWFRGGTALAPSSRGRDRAGNLRRVSLSGVHVDWAGSGLVGLRELELRYHARDVLPTLSEFRRVLRANPALERLVLLGWGPRGRDADPNEDEDDGDGDYERGDDEPIELPQLEELEIGFVEVGRAVEVVALLATPKLRALAIEDVAFGICHDLCARQDCSPLFDRLVSASGAGPGRVPLARLRWLALRGVQAGGASMRGFLGRLGGVVEVCLERVDAGSLVAICEGLWGCEALERVTLKDVDPAATALVLSSGSFPPRLRVFLDVEDDGDGDGGEDLEEEVPEVVVTP